jgi:hypothetical protein
MRIIYFDIDSLRSDHLGCYGYVRKLSPTIDAIAARGIRFDRCYTSDAPCLPSRAAPRRPSAHPGSLGPGGGPRAQTPSRWRQVWGSLAARPTRLHAFVSGESVRC